MRQKTRAQRRVAELAAAQHGAVSARQLNELGVSAESISRQVAVGRLHRVHQGAYALGHPALSRHGRCMAAVLAGGEGAILSHASAAWLWGLSGHYPGIVEVTAPVTRHVRAGLRLHSAATLSPEDKTTEEGIPVTALPRTILDLAARDRRRSPAWALARADRLGILDLIEIDALLQRSSGQRGVARLRQAAEEFREPVFTRSGLERRFLRLVKESALPRPSTNLFVCGYELDAYWSEFRFAVELDTYEYHGNPGTFESDRERQEDLKLAGIEMTRITGRRIAREPAAVAARLKRLLELQRKNLNRRGG
jgi:predicted transcriptional regulator of viral defense system